MNRMNNNMMDMIMNNMNQLNMMMSMLNNANNINNNSNNFNNLVNQKGNNNEVNNDLDGEKLTIFFQRNKKSDYANFKIGIICKYNELVKDVLDRYSFKANEKKDDLLS